MLRLIYSRGTFHIRPCCSRNCQYAVSCSAEVSKAVQHGGAMPVEEFQRGARGGDELDWIMPHRVGPGKTTCEMVSLEGRKEK